ncbi:hypothetical protein, partial [Acinetobacter baumannii]|uniref:hypothetical protein n=1 Tax=Acinetobacter baumannii TaxID=470 RepID=UPI00312CB226
DDVLTSGAPRSYGPYASLDGEVLSGFAPLREGSGAILPLVVKISVTADAWRSQRRGEALFSLLMVLPLVGIVLIGMAALWYRQRR